MLRLQSAAPGEAVNDLDCRQSECRLLSIGRQTISSGIAGNLIFTSIPRE